MLFNNLMIVTLSKLISACIMDFVGATSTICITYTAKAIAMTTIATRSIFIDSGSKKPLRERNTSLFYLSCISSILIQENSRPKNNAISIISNVVFQDA